VRGAVQELLLAHGGLGGAIVESLLVLAIAALFVAVWLRERRGNRSRKESDDS
jgi:hypothetical protein